MKPHHALALGLLGIAQAGSVGAQAPAGAGDVTLVCEAVYLPARATWTRTVRIGYDQQRVRSVRIDDVPVYTFSIRETVILTAIDNERIQIDTAAQTWTSDFRGQATAMGRCERG
ncbi:hypothetical protein [Hydrogenophaga sp.]|uniref:hypothetical protein n=1 Tax=Hydrogenophaga sp. TaxID=1904254 RepID=UPI003D0A172E